MILIFTACITIVVCFLLMKMVGSKTPIDGPRGHWLLGNSPAFVSNFTHKYVLDWFKQYGEIFNVRLLPGMNITFVADPEIAEKLMSSKVCEEKPRAIYGGFDSTGSDNALHAQLFTAPTQSTEWGFVRKGLAKFFTPRNMKTKAGRMMEVAKNLSTDLPAKGTINIDQEMIDLTIDIIGKAGFDYDFTKIEGGCSKITAMVEAITGEGSRKAFAPYRAYMFWDADVKAAKALNEELMELLQVVIDTYKANHPNWKNEKECSTELLGYLLRCKHPDTGEYLPDVQVKCEMFVLLVAGHDTTGHTLGWLNYYLAKHPEFSQAAFEEVKGIMGESRTLTLEQAVDSKTPVLDACLAEAMRLRPVAIGAMRTVSEDVTVKGHLFRKDSTVNFSFLLMHHNPRIYENPSTFNPERFYNPSTLSMARKKRQHISFSAGKRDCIGKRFALMEAKIVMMTMLRNLKMELVDTNEPVAHLTLTLHAHGGIRLKVSPRHD